MLKKPITYTDFNGVQRTEDHYFNLSKSELLKWEKSMSGGLTEWIKRVVQTTDEPALMELMDDLIRKSYGVKSIDGKRLQKNPEVFAEFYESGAYDKLFMELMSTEGAAADFVNAILPADIDREAAAAAIASAN